MDIRLSRSGFTCVPGLAGGGFGLEAPGGEGGESRTSLSKPQARTLTFMEEVTFPGYQSAKE